MSKEHARAAAASLAASGVDIYSAQSIQAARGTSAQTTAREAGKKAAAVARQHQQAIKSGYGSGYVTGAGPTVWKAPSQSVKVSALKPVTNVSPTPAWSLVGSYQPQATKKEATLTKAPTTAPTTAPASETSGALSGIGTVVSEFTDSLLGGAGGEEGEGLAKYLPIAAIVGIVALAGGAALKKSKKGK